MLTEVPANLGFFGTTNCGCPPFNGPFAVAVPSALVGSAVCCNDAVTLSCTCVSPHPHASPLTLLPVEGETVTAIFSGIYDDGAGTENVALSPTAFAALAGFPEDTSLSPVTWSFE